VAASHDERVTLKVTIRPERAAEVAAIHRLNEVAFDGPAEARIVDEMRGTDRWIDGGSLVALDRARRVVGHLLLSEGDLVNERANRRIWLLGPVAVTPELQRRGVGSALMRAAIGLATARKQPLICLLGHAEYYPRFGFEPARPLGIRPPQPWPDAHWLALRLPAWRPELRGTVRYPAAFELG
jgi:putative acetyltransferase